MAGGEQTRIADVSQRTATGDDAPLGFQSRTVERPWDVVVVGGGNAGAVAALSASDLGASVLLIERAPKLMRGGNSRHTRNIRCMREVAAADGFVVGTYPFAELWQDLCNVGEGPNDDELAALTARESEHMPAWMQKHGVRWQKPLTGTLQLDRTNRFFLGGGKALLNTYFREIDTRPNITVAYETKLESFEFDGLRCVSILVSHRTARHRVRCRNVICASGGFEANHEWLARLSGEAAKNFIIRGTPHNDGHVLAELYAAGAAYAGQERGYHAIAVDARSPRFDGGIATRLDTIPFGIVVNKYGKRFADEGEDIWPKRYATWGRRIADQPDQIASAIWDAKVNGMVLPPLYGAYRADDLAELAVQLSLDLDVLRSTIDEYNASLPAASAFNPKVLDGQSTSGLNPPKSNWAQRIDSPPYFGVNMRPGITFTYMGVGVTADARVRMTTGEVFDNVYAAGEIMSGNILSTGYLAGFGMTIGSVWGHRAGRAAARHVA